MENSKIEWTHHTFNPWWGCMKVSAGCKFCYAEVRDNWLYNKQPHWGPNSTRKMMSQSYWNKPIKWDVAAQKAGERHRVFCASMADVFEGHSETLEPLSQLLQLIQITPHLDWLLLTKRPENIMPLTASVWNGVFPPNVWVGTSVENQETADQRIPHLLKVPAVVRFLSMEPLLGPVDLTHLTIYTTKFPAPYGTGINCLSVDDDRHYYNHVDNPVNWVIAGGESGHDARPMHPDWVRKIRDQCNAAGVPFFFKQWGEWSPLYMPLALESIPPLEKDERYLNYAGGHGLHGAEVYCMHKMGKQAAGRMLDSVEHNNFPQPSGISG